MQTTLPAFAGAPTLTVAMPFASRMRPSKLVLVEEREGEEVRWWGLAAAPGRQGRRRRRR